MYSVWNLNNSKLLYLYSYPTLNSPLENAKLQALVIWLFRFRLLYEKTNDCLDFKHCTHTIPHPSVANSGYLLFLINLQDGNTVSQFTCYFHKMFLCFSSFLKSSTYRKNSDKRFEIWKKNHFGIARVISTEIKCLPFAQCGKLIILLKINFM